MNAIISKILEIEWTMFTEVTNAGGRAWCQEDPETFKIMRTSQAMSWTDELLESYYCDLTNAKKNGRNLMIEKYARMMETTFPDEYQKLSHILPVVDMESLELIEKIIASNIQWELEMAQRYPYLSAKGRPIRTEDEQNHVISFETYMRGELKTYSPKTIRLYYEHMVSQKNKGINNAEVNLLNMVKEYGYETLEDAENHIRKVQNPDTSINYFSK